MIAACSIPLLLVVKVGRRLARAVPLAPRHNFGDPK